MSRPTLARDLLVELRIDGRTIGPLLCIGRDPVQHLLSDGSSPSLCLTGDRCSPSLGLLGDRCSPSLGLFGERCTEAIDSVERRAETTIVLGRGHDWRGLLKSHLVLGILEGRAEALKRFDEVERQVGDGRGC
ncbi:hypothetical protein [Methylobacterium sp. WL8]|uniref:hypothetical protein n=1 Tax=Methylobacterium sp. WL8 TaxID=2603899 RepID=UPI0011CA399A|nr:hypothetical protein [Methylobacterium sp. WL8]TXN79301.1 hypothetical protein FV234_21075 [Methylobacterium sp. WL8]